MCTNVQRGNNHNAKYEYKGMKAAGVADYTNQTPKPFRMEKMSKFNEKYFSNVHKIGGIHVQCMGVAEGATGATWSHQ